MIRAVLKNLVWHWCWQYNSVNFDIKGEKRMKQIQQNSKWGNVIRFDLWINAVIIILGIIALLYFRGHIAAKIYVSSGYWFICSSDDTGFNTFSIFVFFYRYQICDVRGTFIRGRKICIYLGYVKDNQYCFFPAFTAPCSMNP